MESNNQPIPMIPTYEQQVEAYLNRYLPQGFRFVPTDEELIIHYLKKKIQKAELPINRFREIDIYQFHPQFLADTQVDTDGQSEWYFFTPRERKYLRGTRPNRTQRSGGNGFWKVTGRDEVVTSSATGRAVGYKNTLDYFEGTHSDNQKTKWKMHEYRLIRKPDVAASNNQRDMKLDDCVLCKIYTSSRCKAGKTNQRQKSSARRSSKSNVPTNDDGDAQHENQDQNYVAPPSNLPVNFNYQTNTQGGQHSLSMYNPSVLSTIEHLLSCSTENSQEGPEWY